MKLPLPPKQLPEFAVSVQGPHAGQNCRAAIYRLMDYMEGLTFRAAQKWAKQAARTCKDDSCLRP